MIETEIHGVKIEVDDQENIKVINISDEVLRIAFENGDTKFQEYVNFDFRPGMWVISNPKDWPYNNSCNIIRLKISSPTHLYVVEYNRSHKKFVDKTDKFYKLDNYDAVPKKVSILIPAHGTQDFIDDTINAFIDINKVKYLDLEIIVLIDGCNEVLRHTADRVYPDYVKVYLSPENLGLSVTKNTLATLSSNEKNILFDSDDIPLPDLVSNVIEELDNFDFVYYHHYEFTNGDDHTKKKNLRKSSNHLGGTFGFIKEKFLSHNGFFPWRVQSDDEFKWRLHMRNIKHTVIESPQYCYRVREDSLSRNPKTKRGTMVRSTYIEVINNKINLHKFDDPENLKCNKNVLRLQ